MVSTQDLVVLVEVLVGVEDCKLLTLAIKLRLLLPIQQQKFQELLEVEQLLELVVLQPLGLSISKKKVLSLFLSLSSLFFLSSVLSIPPPPLFLFSITCFLKNKF
jgi:hypothetical protein